jgi:hypothetical protein
MKQLDNILDTAHQNPTSSNGQIVSYDQVAFIPSARNDLRLRGQDGKPHRPLGEGEQFPQDLLMKCLLVQSLNCYLLSLRQPDA